MTEEMKGDTAAYVACDWFWLLGVLERELLVFLWCHVQGSTEGDWGL